MRAAAICYPSSQAGYATELAEYVGFHASLDCELAESRTAEDFLDLIEQCLVKEFVFVVLCADAIPRAWARTAWEPILLDGLRKNDTRVAYVSRGSCPFPPILKRKNFFENGEFRPLRRWSIQQRQPERSAPEVLRECAAAPELLPLIEAPGVATNVTTTAAAWMVRHCWSDFEAIYHARCVRQTRAAALGGLAQAMGLRLTGTTDQNWEELRKAVSRERSLVLFENLPVSLEDVAGLGGKASVLMLGEDERYVPAAGSNDESLYSLASFMDGRKPLDWLEIRPTGLRALQFLLKQARLAEAQEILEWLAEQARFCGDVRSLEHFRWEEDWILDSWNLAPRARADWTRTQPTQMWLRIPS